MASGHKYGPYQSRNRCRDDCGAHFEYGLFDPCPSCGAGGVISKKHKQEVGRWLTVTSSGWPWSRKSVRKWVVKGCEPTDPSDLLLDTLPSPVR